MAAESVSVFAWLAEALPDLAKPGTRFYWHGRLLSDDALSLAMIRALSMEDRRPGYFASPTHLRNWLLRAGFCISVDEARRAQRHRSLASAAATRGGLPDPRSRQRWSAEEQQAVFACLQLLPDTEKAILVGYYYDRLTDADLARQLYRLPTVPPTLGLRIWRRRQKALAQLRQLLVSKGISEAA